MMQISKHQRAIINAAVKPFEITSNYLGTGLQKLIRYYSKFFAKRRFRIIHQFPAYKNCRYNYVLTLVYNACSQKGGYLKKHRPLLWKFYGNSLLTKYGRKMQRKEIKRKRKKAHRQKAKLKEKAQNTRKQNIHTAANLADNKNCEIMNNGNNEVNDDDDDDYDDNDNDDNYDDDVCEVIEIIEPEQIEQNNASIDFSAKDDQQLNEQTTNSSDPSENWIVQDAVNELANEHQPNESTNESDEDASNDMSRTTINSSQYHEKINCVDEESQEQSSKSSGDINEKLRQQLKLLKMGKSDNSLFTPKENRPVTCTRSTTILTCKRTNSNVSDESGTSNSTTLRRSTNDSSVNSAANSLGNSPKDSDNHDRHILKRTNTDNRDATNKSKAVVAGMIDSLLNKFQSINSNSNITQTRLKLRPSYSPTVTMPAKRTKRDNNTDSMLYASIDSNQDDSNQSATSVSMEFLGFDISNKNLDVSALLPTPKVASTSSNQAAFISEYLDTFMKENSLEKSNNQIQYAPKHCTDEALMTNDAQPPLLSVPERPNDLQRPRTLAEKRMILQQNNDISILIIENESTVYHELKKRVRQGTTYDNTLMRNIQGANIPFTRDCWRAACWIATANNRFFYRTIICDGEEIKLSGGNGDNQKKVAFELNNHEKLPQTEQHLKFIWSECPKKCPPIENIKINNIESVFGDSSSKTQDESSQTKEKLVLLKKSRLCMFAREYLIPGPKCEKVKCKANRKSSFDLEYGPLELVELPMVQLQVWPQVGLPISDHIKPLLKTIPINSNIITPEWAKFAVSVVREAPKQLKHRRKYKKPDIERPEAIVFNIPYENNERKILIRRRRRSSIVFNNNDTLNEHIESFYQNPEHGDQLTFAKHVDSTDTVAVECADILTNMIESIGIAVNDTNFIKQDPDIDYVGKVVSIDAAKESTKIGSKTEKDKNAKSEKTSKNKLIKELRRLNVTVIDTGNDKNSKKVDEICQKTFCKYGCVCASIDTAKYIQIHCQRPECMFECICFNSPFKEGNALLLNNSIDMLQAQANARLAKEEKEFKSTIIVSENDMFVVPNTSTATKRSSKKPKRFTNDETYLEDTETDMIFKSKRRRPEPPEKVITTSQPTVNRQRQNLLKSLQHVRVEVKRLPELDVEPWCLVHCLYKCHCKGRAQRGRIFNFTNKKNDVVGQGSWEIVSPRKRQYTFERENAMNSDIDEPAQKIQRASPSEQNDMNTFKSSRTCEFNWKKRPRRTPKDLKKLKNECMFAENQYVSLLNQRMRECRNYNQAKNILTKAMENGRLVPQSKVNAVTNGHTANEKIVNESIHRLNNIITDMMQRLTALQERGRLSLNPTPNKLSIVAWDRMLHAFKSQEVFIWDIELTENRRFMVLTTTHSRPKADSFVRVTNINYVQDINSLPLVAKMLRNEHRSEKTKYLAMLLLRLQHYWQICGVLHSDLKYMDDELRAKPTPDQNPKLSRKINGLYQLLTTRDIQKNEEVSKSSSIETEYTTTVEHVSPSHIIPSTNVMSSINVASSSNTSQITASIKQKEEKAIKFFENVSMGLVLPLPCDPTQRLLMISLGDDFTHLWFQNWHEFLSMKKIQKCLHESKRLKTSIELTINNNSPRVFVVYTHDNRIFIGPYEYNDRQNIALFIKHDSHMELYENYYKKFGPIYTKKTKASWIYPTSTKNGNVIHDRNNSTTKPSQLRIDQVFSNHHLPTETYQFDSNAKDVENATTSTPKLPVRSGIYAKNDVNGFKKLIPKDGTNSQETVSIRALIQPKSVYVPKKVIELASIQLVNPNENSNVNHDPLPLKISSVASGEEATLLTNGFLDVVDNSKTRSTVHEIKLLTDQYDESDLNEPNDDIEDSSNILIGVQTKTEAVNHDDDDDDDEEQRPTEIEIDEHIESELNAITKDQLNASTSRLKGYIYCSTNIRLGKIKIEWVTPGRIKLHLGEPIEIECVESEAFQKNLECVSSYMNEYIREHFYAVYPAHLRLEWIFIKLDNDENFKNSSLCNLNEIQPFSVVFKEKIVSLLNYQEDATLSLKEKYVLDIYYLASQLFTENEVKKMEIPEILKQSRKIDAELDEQQNKFKRYLAHYKKMVERYTNIFKKQLANQNGTA